jgi:fibronectin type 3 domain-containing protein
MLKNKQLTAIVFTLLSLGAVMFAGCTLEGDLETLREKVTEERSYTPSTPKGVIPSAPTGVTAAAASSSSITVRWSSVSNAASYDVYYESGTSATRNFAGNTTGTSYTHTGLTASTTYRYYVKAKNSTGESVYSSSATATTSSSGSGEPEPTPSAPNAPTGVAATAISSSTIRVSWSSVSNAASYDVYYETGTSTTKNFAGNTTGTSYTHTGLTSGTTFTYYIKAKNNAGESEYSSSASATTDSTMPSAPTGVTAAAASSNSITVSWDPVSNAASYDVYYEIGISSTRNFAGNTAETSYTHTGLTANTTYYYYIKAKNSAGESAYSSFASARTNSSGYNSGPIDLAYDVWHTSSLSSGAVDQYRFYANAGVNYLIFWEDADSSNSWRTADIKVGVRKEGSSSYTVAVTDDGNTGYENAISFSTAVAGYYIIEVHGYSSTSSGSYSIIWSDY